MRIIFEMANNHMGDLDHGVKIIETFSRVADEFDFDFHFKFQFRDLDSFIHPDYKGSDLKFVKRFEDTRLQQKHWDILFEAVRANGFGLIATPFDEASVDKILCSDVDILKIASCSLGDWPLFEKVASSWSKEVIASTAGATEEITDRAVDFFLNRGIDLTLMHCVGLYPTPTNRLDINQITYLKDRYPSIRIGYSTHESPADFVSGAIAYALGSRTFEKHVGLEANGHALNQYSASPEQARCWLESLRHVSKALGESAVKRRLENDEIDGLRHLRRGCFFSKNVSKDHILKREDLFFAIPAEQGGLTANDCSKYSEFKLLISCESGKPVILADLEMETHEPLIQRYYDQVVSLLNASGITFPFGVDLELSHHYGLSNFEQFGLAMITVVNESYCKKLLICLPGQIHPPQYHKLKKETFHVLWGELTITLNGEQKLLRVGDVLTIEPREVHEFVSEAGAVIEEISTTHFGSDSFYLDEEINLNAQRKTFVRLRAKSAHELL